eukprot:SAG11_NODE_40446_length_201_cov_33.931373_1_plen_44_part_10
MDSLEWNIYQSYKSKQISFEEYNTLSDEEIVDLLWWRRLWFYFI